MYRLQIHCADAWTILDDHDDEVFQGTLAECEAWLDGQENRERWIGQRRKVTAGLRSWIHQLWETPSPITPLLPPGSRAASNSLPQRQ